jgi:hypothetical protein
MWVRICAQAPMANVERPLIEVNDHPNRLSRSHRAGVIFVDENRRIRKRLLNLFPAQLRPYARRYVLIRHNVLDTHELITSLVHRRFRDARDLIRVLGVRDLLAGIIAWLLTVDNRLYCPKPDFTRWQ